jgi:putative peptide zinc metalloprotease protein
MTAEPQSPGRHRATTPDRRWRHPEGLALLGPVQGSGLREQSYLVSRADGQVVQLSELLYLAAAAVDPRRTSEEAAEEVSDRYGRTLTAEGYDYLLEKRLEPLGLVEDAEATILPPAPRARPLLSLSLKGTILPARAVRLLSPVLAPLFHPVVVAAALVGVVVVDVMMLRQGNLMAALEQLLSAPALLLALYALTTAAGVFHEMGHAAACRYGGAQPGRIGFGVYLVFPAFYTDVTDSYRLDRAGRVRTDLGGLYFNALTLLGGGLLYLATGNGLVLLFVLLLHFEMVQQLMPAVRFDGYYVLADLAGVPDLFARVRPVMRSLVPGRPVDPRVAELRPRARRLVVGWVLFVVPTLIFGLGWLMWHLPVIVSRTWTAIGLQSQQLVLAWESVDVVVVVSSAISILLLMVPLAGVAVLIWRIAALSTRPLRS